MGRVWGLVSQRGPSEGTEVVLGGHTPGRGREDSYGWEVTLQDEGTAGTGGGGSRRD